MRGAADICAGAVARIDAAARPPEVRMTNGRIDSTTELAPEVTDGVARNGACRGRGTQGFFLGTQGFFLGTQRFSLGTQGFSLGCEPAAFQAAQILPENPGILPGNPGILPGL